MKLGAKIRVKEFNFTNIHGGTGMSRPFGKPFGDNEYFLEPIDVIITKIWDDYETGIRGWAEPNPKNKKLMKYLEKNCKQGYNKIIPVPGKSYVTSKWVNEPEKFVLYWSEFDVI
jgi:hypothetical protein